MTEANPHRGETSIKLAGDEYKAKLSLGDMMVLERRLKIGLIELGARFALMKVGIEELVMLTEAMLKGGGNDMKSLDVKSLIEQTGLMESLEVVGVAFGDVLDPGGNSRAVENPED